jgi:hypothetical protein
MALRCCVCPRQMPKAVFSVAVIRKVKVLFCGFLREGKLDSDSDLGPGDLAPRNSKCPMSHYFVRRCKHRRYALDMPLGESETKSKST